MMKLLPRRLEDSLFFRLRIPLAIASGLSLAAFLLFWKLNSLFSGPSGPEVALLATDDSPSSLIDNPLYFQFKLLVSFFELFVNDQVLALRLAGVTNGIAATGLLVYLLSLWYWRSYAIAGGLLFLSSSWVFGVFRIGTPEATIVTAALALLVLLTKAYHHQSLRWNVLLAASVALSLYIPMFGYIAFPLILVGVIATYRRGFDYSARMVFIPLGIALLLSAPLVVRAVTDTDIAKQLLLLETTPSITDFLIALTYPIRYVFINSDLDPNIHLKDLPMLELFTTTIVLVGAYRHIRDSHSERSRMILIFTLAATFGYAIGGNDAHMIIFSIPVYIVAISGLYSMVEYWGRMFPNNLTARNFVYIPLIFTLLITLNYHYRRHFVATPNNLAVAQAHSELYSSLDGLNLTQSTAFVCDETATKTCLAVINKYQDDNSSLTLQSALRSSVLEQTQIIITDQSILDESEKIATQLLDSEKYTQTITESLVSDETTLYRVFQAK